jgi:TolA-binding protein
LQASSYFWKGESYYQQKKYNEAIKSHMQFLGLLKLKPRLAPNVSELNAEYSLGYASLKQEEYAKASDYFDDVMKALSSSTVENDRKIYADALLRNGDCRFVLKNYASAISSYDAVISKKLPGADYALYQKSIIQGLQNNSTGKLASLRKITDDFPGSIYMDDALYELGITYTRYSLLPGCVSCFQPGDQ